MPSEQTTDDVPIEPSSIAFPKAGDTDEMKEFRNICKDVLRRMANLPFPELGDISLSAEERGKLFIAREYGVDPEEYAWAINSIDCMGFGTRIANADMGQWLDWKDKWAAGGSSMDPVVLVQVSWALLCRFHAKFDQVDGKVRSLTE